MNQISPKVKFYTNHLNWSIFSGGRGDFGVEILEGKNLGPLKSLDFRQLS